MIVILPNGVRGGTLNPMHGHMGTGEGWGSFRKLWGPMRGVVGAIFPIFCKHACKHRYRNWCRYYLSLLQASGHNFSG